MKDFPAYAIYGGVLQSTVPDVAVFPTHVGMVLLDCCPAPTAQSIPHACGDGSANLLPMITALKCSPRMWGWFHKLHQASNLIWGVPHACGDGSVIRRSSATLRMYSPRMWGWFYWIVVQRPLLRVFPTHVGMVPSGKEWSSWG